MTDASTVINFKSTLPKPEIGGSPMAWCFLVLPRNDCAKLPTRSMTSVSGTKSGVSSEALLEPDGNSSHWFKVSKKLCLEADAKAGDVTL